MKLQKKLSTLLALFMLLIACSESTTESSFKEVANPSPTNKPEIIEFFSYFCRHCYQLDLKVETWRKRLPKSVGFKRVPLTLGNSSGKIYSRVFYIGEKLGILDKSHPAMFELFHKKKQQLNSELQLKNFFLSLGVTTEDFDKALNDPAIDANIQQAEAMAKQYRIIGVPGFIINGKYFIDVASSGGEKQLFDQINRLLRKK